MKQSINNLPFLYSEITSKKEKEQIIERVLMSLPEWFGLEDARQEYIDNGSNYKLWSVATNNEIIGFISLKETSSATMEIYCMGVIKEYHRLGIGDTLVHLAIEDIKKDYSFLQVKTVEEGHYLEYDKTVAFYKSQGFKELEVFPNLWDEWNPCLVLIRSL